MTGNHNTWSLKYVIPDRMMIRCCSPSLIRLLRYVFCRTSMIIMSSELWSIMYQTTTGLYVLNSIHVKHLFKTVKLEPGIRSGNTQTCLPRHCFPFEIHTSFTTVASNERHSFNDYKQVSLKPAYVLPTQSSMVTWTRGESVKWLSREWKHPQAGPRIPPSSERVLCPKSRKLLPSSRVHPIMQ